MIRSVRFVIGMLMIIAITSCGSGGGVVGVSSNSTATVAIRTEGNASSLYGVEFKAILPSGVTLKTLDNGDLDPSIIMASGVATGAMVVSNYQSSVSSRTLSVSLVKDNYSSFPTGEFLTLTCTLPSGGSINPTDVNFSSFKAFDANGAVIPGITGSIVVK